MFGKRLRSGIYCSALSLVVVALAAAQHAAAQTYPIRPVQVVVPFPSGSGSDVIARLVFDRMSQKVGQQFIIDNRAGAGGMVGTRAVAMAPADGYTLLFSASGPLATNKALMTSLSYDPERDFAFISKVAVQPNVFVVNSRLPVKTVKEFVAFAKSQQTPLNYSSIGIGSSSHLAAVQFATAVGIDLTHVPYKGMSQLVSDLISGEVPISFTVLTNAKSAVQSGQVRALAVAAAARLSRLPDVPTLAEAGFPGLEVSAWFAVVAPRDTPQSVVDFLNRAIAEALADPVVRERMSELGALPSPTTPDELKAEVASEIQKWRKLSEQTGIRIEQ